MRCGCQAVESSRVKGHRGFTVTLASAFRHEEKQVANEAALTPVGEKASFETKKESKNLRKEVREAGRSPGSGRYWSSRAWLGSPGPCCTPSPLPGRPRRRPRAPLAPERPRLPGSAPTSTAHAGGRDGQGQRLLQGQVHTPRQAVGGRCRCRGTSRGRRHPDSSGVHCNAASAARARHPLPRRDFLSPAGRRASPQPRALGVGALPAWAPHREGAPSTGRPRGRLALRGLARTGKFVLPHGAPKAPTWLPLPGCSGY